jgi:DNA repair protein RadC
MSAPRVRLVRVGFVRERSPKAAPAPVAITGPDRAESILRAILPHDREGFAVVHLNARHEPMSVEVVSVGSLNAAIVHPREVFKGAILAGAASIILGHNHPSGDAEPSGEDLSITRRLVQVGELVGIGVLDHVIIGRPGVRMSFRDRGIL